MGLRSVVPPDKGLQDGSRHLKSQRQQADLAEVQVERGFQNGIDGRQHRLDGVVQQVAKAHRYQHPENSPFLEGARVFYLSLFGKGLRSHAGPCADPPTAMLTEAWFSNLVQQPGAAFFW